MMLPVLVEATARSLLLGIAVWLLLRILRIRAPRFEWMVWLAVLGSSLLMPWLMRLSLLPVPVAQFDIAPLDMPQFAAARDWPLAALTIGYWLVVLVLLARELGALVVCVRLLYRAEPADDCFRAGIESAVVVRVSREISTPVTIGRTVVLPWNFLQWTAAERRAMLTHELAHVRHGDFFVQQLARAHRALFWINPLAWWLPRRLALLGEQLSDDAAMRVLPDPIVYAEILLQCASAPHRVHAAVGMAGLVSVAQRIERVLEAHPRSRRGDVWKHSLFAMILLPLVWLVGGCSDRATPTQQLAARSAAPAPRAASPSPTATPTDVGTDDLVLPRSLPSVPLSQPQYPPQSRRGGQQGTVVLELHVLPDGSVDDVKIRESSGHARLDLAAANEALNWQLDPGRSNGRVTPMWGRFAVTFKLTK